jgi:AraC-like DNA-binding protein
MSDFQLVVEQIPIRHDWISVIMLGAIIQGLMISLVVALRSNAHNQPIQFLGGFIFSISLIGLDIYLCHTGLMKYVLWANDSTEFLVLLLGPLMYFFTLGVLQKERLNLRKNWYHLAIPLAYFISQLGYTIQPQNVKLNHYIGGFFSGELPYVSFEKSQLLEFSKLIKDELRLIILFSFLLYFFLSFKLIWKNRKNIRPTLNLQSGKEKYGFSNNAIWGFGLAFVIMLTVFLTFDSDLGDHLIATFFSMCIYLITFSMLSQSRFLEKSWLSDKYDTSGLKTNEKDMLGRITSFVEAEGYFLAKNASLKDLARQLNVPANYLSQVINNQTEKNFNDFINQYRIEAAKLRLLDPAYAHLDITGIGETVGFNSKSAFYTAFKKFTQKTPAAFLREQKAEGKS